MLKNGKGILSRLNFYSKASYSSANYYTQKSRKKGSYYSKDVPSEQWTVYRSSEVDDKTARKAS